MKQVIEQYASSMIATVLAVMLLGIIGHGVYEQKMGIGQVLGRILQDSIEETSIVENGVLEAFSKEAKM